MPRAFETDGTLRFEVPRGVPLRLQWQRYRREGDDWKYVEQRFLDAIVDGEELMITPPQS